MSPPWTRVALHPAVPTGLPAQVFPLALITPVGIKDAASQEPSPDCLNPFTVTTYLAFQLSYSESCFLDLFRVLPF